MLLRHASKEMYDIMRVRLVTLLLLFGAMHAALLHAIAGVPHTGAELNEYYWSPPAGQNGAGLFVRGFDALNIASNERWSESLPWIGRGKVPELGKPLPLRTATEIKRLLDHNRQAMALIAQAATYEFCRYPMDLANGPETLLPHLAKLKQASQCLGLYSMWKASTGDSSNAVEGVLWNFALANSLRQEPILVSQAIREATRHYQLRSLEQVINRVAVTPEVLDRLGRVVGSQEKEDAAGLWLSRALIGDAITCRMFVEMPFDKRFEMITNVAKSLTPTEAVMNQAARNETAEKDFLESFFGLALESWQKPYPQRIEAVTHVCSNQLQAARNKSFMIGAISVRRVDDTLGLDALDVARLRVSAAAIALEKFRAKNHQYPEKLSAVSEYADGSLTDPFTGALLQYERSGKGYSLQTGKPSVPVKAEPLTFFVVTPVGR